MIDLTQQQTQHNFEEHLQEIKKRQEAEQTAQKELFVRMNQNPFIQPTKYY